MRYTCGPSVVIGETVLAPVVQTSTFSAAHAEALWILATRQPVAVLVRTDGVVRACDLSGSTIPLKEFDVRFPGQISAFRHQFPAAD